MPPQCIIVDDYQPFLKVARAKLEQQGIAVGRRRHQRRRGATPGTRLSPDVALIDISLGQESGFDLERQITPYVGSVILISSHDHDQDDEYAELIEGSPAVGS